MDKISSTGARFGESLLRELSQTKGNSGPQAFSGGEETKSKKASFTDHLESGIKNVNQAQKLADKKGTDLATGKEQNIHETMLAASQAELSFNLMVQIRNKAIEAYQEIMRMPV